MSRLSSRFRFEEIEGVVESARGGGLSSLEIDAMVRLSIPRDRLGCLLRDRFVASRDCQGVARIPLGVSRSTSVAAEWQTRERGLVHQRLMVEWMILAEARRNPGRYTTRFFARSD
jgi:hypothetical protein